MKLWTRMTVSAAGAVVVATRRRRARVSVSPKPVALPAPTPTPTSQPAPLVELAAEEARDEQRLADPGARFCPNCGDPHRADAHFCAGCGTCIEAVPSTVS